MDTQCETRDLTAVRSTKKGYVSSESFDILPKDVCSQTNDLRPVESFVEKRHNESAPLVLKRDDDAEEIRLTKTNGEEMDSTAEVDSLPATQENKMADKSEPAIKEEATNLLNFIEVKEETGIDKDNEQKFPTNSNTILTDSCQTSTEPVKGADEAKSVSVDELTETGGDQNSNMTEELTGSRRLSSTENNVEMENIEEKVEGEHPEAVAKGSEHDECNDESRKARMLENNLEANDISLELDDTCSESLKRRLAENNEWIANKRARIRKTFDLNAFEKFLCARNVDAVSREDLEDYCLMKFCEALSYDSELARTRLQLKQMEVFVDDWRRKMCTWSKQTRDLEFVHSRLMQDINDPNRTREVSPIKITRSVGLQVSLPMKGKLSDLPLSGSCSSTKTKDTTKWSPLTTKQQAQPQSQSITKKQINTFALKTAESKQTKSGGTQVTKATDASLSLTSPKATSSKPTTIRAASSRQSNPPNLSPSTQGSSPKAQQSQPPKLQQRQPTQQAPMKALVLRKLQPGSVTVHSPKAQTAQAKGVIDLTDEDEPAKKCNGNSIRLVTPQTTTATNGTALAYIVQTSGQQNPMLITTSPASQNGVPSRPTQIRPVVFKPGAIPTNRTSVTIRPGLQTSPVAVSQKAPSLPQLGARNTVKTSSLHPAPPPAPVNGPDKNNWRPVPPRPSLKISRVTTGGGIVLSWKMNVKNLSAFEEISSYQLFAYQETSEPPSTDMWKKVGDVKALALPMACTLTQFLDGNKYYFAVRAVDIRSRVGEFSTPEKIELS